MHLFGVASLKLNEMYKIFPEAETLDTKEKLEEAANIIGVQAHKPSSVVGSSGMKGGTTAASLPASVEATSAKPPKVELTSINVLET